MAVEQGAPGLRIIRYSGLPLAKPRNLVQASDFDAALRDTTQFEIQRISHMQPTVLIETKTIVGPDRLTASDAALYDLLLVNAKKSGIDRSEHSIELSAMMAFVGVRHVERLRTSRKRIAQTRVRYDIAATEFRDGGSVPLIIAEGIVRHYSKLGICNSGKGASLKYFNRPLPAWRADSRATVEGSP